ncbi:MAG: hypothetical protein J5819_04165, partial [Eubacterium sp.]|nr:hypothetical protein [Eubacterium sp.]
MSKKSRKIWAYLLTIALLLTILPVVSEGAPSLAKAYMLIRTNDTDWKYTSGKFEYVKASDMYTKSGYLLHKGSSSDTISKEIDISWINEGAHFDLGANSDTNEKDAKCELELLDSSGR